jgi:hypothetical protein
MEKITGISLYSQNINGLSNFKFTQLLYAIRKKKSPALAGGQVGQSGDPARERSLRGLALRSRIDIVCISVDEAAEPPKKARKKKKEKKKKSFFNKLQIFSDCKHFNTSLALKQYYLSAQEESVGASLLGGDRHRGPGADVLDG